MPKPICFMVMPYGTKPAQKAPGNPGPDKVNFDRLWNAAFFPALRDLGYDAVRADQDLGAGIIQEMIERLAISDLVVADVSTPNGNVYYEIGVRHAAKPNGCVMIAADWTQPLFDLNQMRQVRYPLPAEVVDDATAETIREKLKVGIPPLAQGATPVYQFLPGYPGNVDVGRASAFRKSLEELAAFQGEVRATRTMPEAQRKTKALELRDRFVGGPMQPVVAMELLYLIRDGVGWPETIDFIASLPGPIQELPVVKEQKALAQSKDGDHFLAIAGLEGLITFAGDSSERRGLLGGRYKKLHDTEQDPKQKAQYLDKAIAEYEKGMRLDLNDYYPSSNLARLYRTRKRRGDEDRAKVSAAVTQVACERAQALGSPNSWLKQTLLGAAFDAGDVTKAGELADQIRSENAVGWNLKSTIADLERAITFYQGDTASGLNEILSDLKTLA